jgi:anti-anti-sigma regulatory factor
MQATGSIAIDEGCPGGWTHLVLQGRLSVLSAHSLKQAALELTARTGGVLVICSELDELDGASLQILLCLKRELSAAQRSFRFGDVSEPVRQMLSLVSLDEDCLAIKCSPCSAAQAGSVHVEDRVDCR